MLNKNLLKINKHIKENNITVIGELDINNDNFIFYGSIK